MIWLSISSTSHVGSEVKVVPLVNFAEHNFSCDNNDLSIIKKGDSCVDVPAVNPSYSSVVSFKILLDQVPFCFFMKSYFIFLGFSPNGAFFWINT
jgi:hypothetical protein